MKLTFPVLFLTPFLLSLPLHSAPRSQDMSQMRDVAKHDDLSQRLRMAQQKDPVRELGPEAGESDVDPSVANAPKDFVKNSAIISFRGVLTLVPKRSVLHVPDKLKERMKATPDSKVKTFQEFLQYNRGWIRTVEVSREQALGHVPFSESTTESISKSSSIVIATFKKGPISVLPLKAEEEVPTRSEMKPVTYAR